MKNFPNRDRQGRNEDYEHRNRSDYGLKNGAPSFHIASNNQVERRAAALTTNEAGIRIIDSLLGSTEMILRAFARTDR